jgi:hypothetical protein
MNRAGPEPEFWLGAKTMKPAESDTMKKFDQQPEAGVEVEVEMEVGARMRIDRESRKKIDQPLPE